MKKILLLMFTLLFSFSLFAEKPYYEDEYEGDSEIESWYLQLGLGFSSINYDNSNYDDYSNNDNLDRKMINIDLGVYVPLDDKLLIGGVIFGEMDRYSNSNDDWVQLNSYILGISAIYFTKVINDGFFVRGDFGYTDMNASNSDGDSAEIDESEKGTGFRLAAGYALKTNPDWSLLFTLGYANKGFTSEKIQSLNFTVSFLF
ncbi:outer membrane beta-barrel protein [bacterium]|nr:outer membrane beta-barrel protein [bacterium]